MINTKKALAAGAFTILSFPNILFAQDVSPARFKDINIFSGAFTATIDGQIPLSQDKSGISKDMAEKRTNYLDTDDNADKALDRVYEKVNKLLSDMVDEMTRSKNTPPGMWRR